MRLSPTGLKEGSVSWAARYLLGKLTLGFTERRGQRPHGPLPYHNLHRGQYVGLLLQYIEQGAGKSAAGLADLRNLPRKRRLQIFDEARVQRKRRTGENDRRCRCIV